MLAAEDIVTQLKAETTSLGTIDRAVDVAALMDSKPQPHGKPLAHVVVMGLRGGEVTSMTDYIQNVSVVYAVILTIPSHSDAAGKRAAGDVLKLITEVCAALCGWGPVGAPGVSTLVRTAVVSATKPGAIVYSIEFALNDQLRFQ
jgi:hypothetical protein